MSYVWVIVAYVMITHVYSTHPMVVIINWFWDHDVEFSNKSPHLINMGLVLLCLSWATSASFNHLTWPMNSRDTENYPISHPPCHEWSVHVNSVKKSLRCVVSSFTFLRLTIDQDFWLLAIPTNPMSNSLKAKITFGHMK